ncbi:hypothetical protein [Atopococcus tabaci]|uniref:hypothetical protein n=1 Tax=Atopococcus tabaci TaxID=269774 RepID=UPI0024097482|nr:hypothetical protein [Atopococcus tabaci]
MSKEYYDNDYLGKAVKTENFDRLSKEAERMISSKTRHSNWDKLTETNRNRVKDAICVLIEYGNDVAANGGIQGGFSIGAFRMDANAVPKPDEAKAWKRVNEYLFRTGLLYGGVNVW